MRMWLLKTLLRPLIRQGPWLYDHLDAIFGVIHELYREEFTEDNLPTERAVLSESLERVVCVGEPAADIPQSMWPDTSRGGVIGYMCMIDFECELGGTTVAVHTSAEKALCAGTCGVVEVEVIGRKIIIDETPDEIHEADEDTVKAYVDEVTQIAKDYDATR